ncbi:hypothetical protein [Flavobacterium limnophilum]|uniref:hypothetical protein n=1 Tax=Flavobacterium limnophilum TaxID=3003262 RepID=UPI0024823482|nr:hypothetical protein [Flavobacterium limnophilum]
MNKKTITITVLLVLNIFCLYKYKNCNEALELAKTTQKKESSLQKELQKDNERMYQNNLIASKKNENLKLEPNLKLISIEGDSVFAKDIFKTNSLVLRYSVLNCGDCIDAEIENLEKYAKPFSEKIIIITHYENLRRLIIDYKNLQKLGLDKVTVYMLPSNKLGIPMEENNIPYYFHIDPKLTISNVFIPMREEPRLSEYYLKYSFKNYFEK